MFWKQLTFSCSVWSENADAPLRESFANQQASVLKVKMFYFLYKNSGILKNWIDYVATAEEPNDNQMDLSL